MNANIFAKIFAKQFYPVQETKKGRKSGDTVPLIFLDLILGFIGQRQNFIFLFVENSVRTEINENVAIPLQK